MDNLNLDVQEIFKGRSEIKYFDSFKDLSSLEREMQKMVDQGWEYHCYYLLTPLKEVIYIDKEPFDPLFFPLHFEKSNIFEDFIDGKIKGHEKLKFGDKVHIRMRDAYGFYLGMNYLLWEKRIFLKGKSLKIGNN